MTSETKSRQKPPSYYQLERSDLVAELPPPIGRALDVGCGAGGVGRALRAAARRGARRGDPRVGCGPGARVARHRDGLLGRGRAREAVTSPGRSTRSAATTSSSTSPIRKPCSCALRDLAAPGGRLHISIPNARHFSLVVDLVLRGTFGYREWGHRDSTHLRWYTRRDLVALVDSAGWKVALGARSRVHRAATTATSIA